jgi:cytosine/uracil/thiamine/allantoin permease
VTVSAVSVFVSAAYMHHAQVFGRLFEIGAGFLRREMFGCLFSDIPSIIARIVRAAMEK